MSRESHIHPDFLEAADLDDMTDSAVGYVPRQPKPRLAQDLGFGDVIRVNPSRDVVVIDDEEHGLPTPATRSLIYPITGQIVGCQPTAHGAIFVISYGVFKVTIFMQHRHRVEDV